MSKFFDELKQALEEALAYERGEIDLSTHTVSTDDETIGRNECPTNKNE